MQDYGPSTYGDRIAEAYDEFHGSTTLDPSAAVELLAELAGDGRALELGIGTGRVAIPLAAKGVRVEGVDASEAMVARLRAKPGGAEIPVTVGDFADLPVDGTFRLVYIPFTTFFALTSQADQLRCLRRIAGRLEPGGWFVMDAFVPDIGRFRDNQAVTVPEVTPSRVILDTSRHDPVTQTISSAHVVLEDGGVRIYPVFIRYAWPAELDALALAAGLEPVGRFGDYERHPFDADSTRHVSIYRRA
jgi:SAM-dependent methyltransferase